jgi:hypothetical protein
MNNNIYIVTYIGPFGFIKPWTAVRDGETYSQQFLTPSIIEGMRQKLEVSDIVRHKLAHDGYSRQQEVTQSSGFKSNGQRERSIIVRGAMLRPALHLAFPSEEDARRAHRQHLCLCRNEDVVFASGPVREMETAEFDEMEGFELRFGQGDDSFLVGYNRFEDGAPMYGRLEITGDPTRINPIGA